MNRLKRLNRLNGLTRLIRLNILNILKRSQFLNTFNFNLFVVDAVVNFKSEINFDCQPFVLAVYILAGIHLKI